MKQDIKAHMKRDIKEYRRMAEEDRAFMKGMKKDKHEKHENKREEKREHAKHHEKKDPLKPAEKRAMHHADKLGAGAKKRKKLKPESKVKVVMEEFSKGLLHSGSGAKVTNPKQALAIGYSEARKRKGK